MPCCFLTSYDDEFINYVLRKCVVNERVFYDFESMFRENYDVKYKLNQLTILRNIIKKCYDAGIFKNYVDDFYRSKAFLANLIEGIYLMTSSRKMTHLMKLPLNTRAVDLSFEPVRIYGGSYNIVVVGKLFPIDRNFKRVGSKCQDVALRVLYNSSYTDDFNDRIYYADEYSDNLKKIFNQTEYSDYILKPFLCSSDFKRRKFDGDYTHEPTSWSIIPICRRLPEKLVCKKNEYTVSSRSSSSRSSSSRSSSSRSSSSEDSEEHDLRDCSVLTSDFLDSYFKTVMFASDIIHASGSSYRDWKFRNCMLNGNKIVLTDIDFERENPISTIRCKRLAKNVRKNFLMYMFDQFPKKCQNILKKKIDFNYDISFDLICDLLPEYDLKKYECKIDRLNRNVNIILDNSIAFYSWLINAVYYMTSIDLDCYTLDNRKNCEELMDFLNRIDIINVFSGKTAYEKICDYIVENYSGKVNDFVCHEFKNLLRVQ